MKAFFIGIGLIAAMNLSAEISFRDGCETITTNPARGHAGGGWITFKPEGLPNWHGQSGYHSSLWELSRFSGGREQGGKRPLAERVGGVDRPLTEAMKGDVRRFLSETRAKGGSLIVRLGYTWSEQQGCEPADFEIVLGHVRDLSAIMADFPDVVMGVEAGVAGPWGEMHSSDYCREEYMNRILKTYVDNLGAHIPVLVRAPAYFNKFAGVKTEELLARLPFEDKYLRRLGMYNDGYLGTWWDYGTWAGDFTRERGVKLLKSLDDAPYGGEMAYIGRDWLEKNRDLFDLRKWNIVREWYETHLNYLRNITEGGHTLASFLKDELVFRAKDYAYEGGCELGEYDGTTMSKFLMDHMGYRYVVRAVELPKRFSSKEHQEIVLGIENTGFGKLLPASRAAVLLVTGEKVVMVPVKLALRKIGGGTRERIKVAVDLAKAGIDAADGREKVTVMLRVWCPCVGEAKLPKVPLRPVRFANEGMWNDELKANILGESLL